MTIETEWRNYDVVVVGSGGAGSMAARAAAEESARVLVASKDPIGCSDTKISEGNATVRQVATDDDSEETLSENLCMAGGNLPVKEITDAFAKDSKTAFDRFRAQGLRPRDVAGLRGAGISQRIFGLEQPRVVAALVFEGELAEAPS